MTNSQLDLTNESQEVNPFCSGLTHGHIHQDLHGFLYFNYFQCDVFELNAVDLDDLVKVKVVHDGAGPGSGWYLDKIIARTSESGDTRYVFNCGK